MYVHRCFDRRLVCDGALDPLVDVRWSGLPDALLGHVTTSRTISATPVETLWESGVFYAAVMGDSECFSGLPFDRAHAPGGVLDAVPDGDARVSLPVPQTSPPTPGRWDVPVLSGDC
jgi:hypothetical protein